MRSRGFTLLETLVALVIIAGTITMLSMTWSGSFMRIRKSGINYDVAMLLERKMVEIEAKYLDRPIAEIPADEEGDFGDDYPRYRWTMQSQDMKFPDLTPLIVGGNPDGANEMMIAMIKQMTEFLNRVVKEVKVTVWVKAQGDKELQFSAAQYFVDYSQELTGGGAGANGAAGNAGSSP